MKYSKEQPAISPNMLIAIVIAEEKDVIRKQGKQRKKAEESPRKGMVSDFQATREQKIKT